MSEVSTSAASVSTCTQESGDEEGIRAILQELRQKNVNLEQHISQLEKSLAHRKLVENISVRSDDKHYESSTGGSTSQSCSTLPGVGEERPKWTQNEILMRCRIEECRRLVEPKVQSILENCARKNSVQQKKLLFGAVDIRRIQPQLFLCKNSPSTNASGTNCQEELTMAIVGPRNLRKRTNGVLRIADQIVSIDNYLISELIKTTPTALNVIFPANFGERCGTNTLYRCRTSNHEICAKRDDPDKYDSKSSELTSHDNNNNNNRADAKFCSAGNKTTSVANFLSHYLNRRSSKDNNSSILIFGILRQTIKIMATIGSKIQVEIIRFFNDAFGTEGGGLGFGIVGGPSTGVVVKTILPGSAAYKDNHLRAGDRILQVGNVNVQGMSSQQVATLLRQPSGASVELVVGRPIISNNHVEIDTKTCWIMETKKALCPFTLDEVVQKRLSAVEESVEDPTVVSAALTQMVANGSINCNSQMPTTNLANEARRPSRTKNTQRSEIESADSYDAKRFVDGIPPSASTSTAAAIVVPEAAVAASAVKAHIDCRAQNATGDDAKERGVKRTSTRNGRDGGLARKKRPGHDSDNPVLGKSKSSNYEHRISLKLLQELALTTFCRENWIEGKFKYVDVELFRDPNIGLGITVAGYVYKREEINGVFVKSLVPNSNAYRCKQIQVHDLIITANDHSLENLSHTDSVRTLIKCGNKVRLKMVRFERDTPQAKCLQMLHDQELSNQQEQNAAKSLAFLNKYKNEWENRLGSDYEIIAVELRPDKDVVEDGGLGISLEGTVDVVDGNHLCPHHFIESLRQNGPASKAGVLKAGDELLQVNECVMYGESHVTVLQTLSRAVDAAKKSEEAPPIRIYFCRKAQQVNMYMPNAEQSLPLSYSLLAAMHEDRIVKAKSETTLFTLTRIEDDLCCDSEDEEIGESENSPNFGNGELSGQTTANPSRSRSTSRRDRSSRHLRLRTSELLKEASRKLRSRSLEQLSSLAVWHCVPIVVTLEKDSKGLGFSVVDYQDPLHSTESVIVVRSLVPGGVAQADGRIVPGDRLLFVNVEDLSHASLDRAVAALKSAPLGLVRLGIAKPVPVDQLLLGEHRPLISRSERLLAKRSSPARKHRRDILASYHPRAASASASLTPSQKGGTNSIADNSSTGGEHSSTATTATTVVNDYLRNRNQFYQHQHRSLISAAAAGDISSQEEIWIGAENYRRLNPQLYFASSSGSISPASFRSGGANSMLTWSPCSSRSISPTNSSRGTSLKGSWSYDVVFLPSHLERTIKIFKGATAMGVVVDSDVDKALNGCLVKSICSKKAIGRDGRIQVGDYIVKINSECLRNVTNSQARAIFKRTNLIGTQCSVSYITSSDAKLWKERLCSAKNAQNCENDSLTNANTSANTNSGDFDSPLRTPPFSRLSPKVFPKFYRSPIFDEKLQKVRTDGKGEVAAERCGESSESTAPKDNSIDQILLNYFNAMEFLPFSNANRVDDDRDYRQALETFCKNFTIRLLCDAIREICVQNTNKSYLPPLSGDKLKLSDKPREFAPETEIRDEHFCRTYTEIVASPKRDISQNFSNDFSHTSSTTPQSASGVHQNLVDASIPTAAQLHAADVSAEQVVNEAIAVAARGMLEENGGIAADQATHSKRQAHSYSRPLRSSLKGSRKKSEHSVSSSRETKFSEELNEKPSTSAAGVKSRQPTQQQQNITEDGAAMPSTSKEANNVSQRQKHEQSGNNRNFWCVARTVILNRQPSETFGISIVGGRVEVSQRGSLPGQPGNTVSGIFIKSVVADSQAGRSGKMFMGDRVISVNDFDLRNATHEYAVQVIKNATNPVKFVVQSLQSFLPNQMHASTSSATSTPETNRRKRVEIIHESTQQSENGPAKLPESEPPKTPLSSRIPNGGPHYQQILRVKPEPESAAALESTPGDTECEDRFFYTKDKIRRKYGSLPGEPILIRLENIPPKGLGFSLANGDPKQNSRCAAPNDDGTSGPPVIVVDIKSTSPLPLQVGDELLEINAKVLFGLSHMSASEKIRECCAGDELALLILRRGNGVDDSAADSFAEMSAAKSQKSVDNTASSQINSDGKVQEGVDNSRKADETELNNSNTLGDTSTNAVAGCSSLSPVLPAHHQKHSTASTNNGTCAVTGDGEPRKKSWQAPHSPNLQSHHHHSSASPMGSGGERTVQIENGKETWIEIDKDGKGLGLSIVGGSDTVLGTVVIHEVYKDGAAFHDGRLQPGDQVLEVNNTSLRGISHEQAISLLRRTPAKVRLLVYRDENLRSSLSDPKQLYDIYTVELAKKPGRGLGISIVGRKHEPGVYISEIVKGGVADLDGQVMPGDQILEVNEYNVQESMQEDVATILKTCTGRVSLKMGRWKMVEAANRVHAAQPPTLSAEHQQQMPLRQQQNIVQQQHNNTDSNNVGSSTMLNNNNNNNVITENGNENNNVHDKPYKSNRHDSNGGNSTAGAGPKNPPPPPAPYGAPGTSSSTNTASNKIVPPLQITVQDENQQQVIRSDLSPVSEEDLKSIAETTASEDTHYSSHSSVTQQRIASTQLHQHQHHHHSHHSRPHSASTSSATSPASQRSSGVSGAAGSSKLRTDLTEEGSDQLLIRLRKDDGNQWGMGIGKRQRGILITSLQPGSTAAEKLAVGDRIMAVNEKEVTDQLSAVTYVRESGNDVALQIARPTPNRT